MISSGSKTAQTVVASAQNDDHRPAAETLGQQAERDLQQDVAERQRHHQRRQHRFRQAIAGAEDRDQRIGALLDRRRNQHGQQQRRRQPGKTDKAAGRLAVILEAGEF